jgi:hypothetical protein
MMLRIGILGTRGIPNCYGGFEQFAAYLSAGLVQKGHEVSVYSPHDHPYQEAVWQGVAIIHCYDPGMRVKESLISYWYSVIRVVLYGAGCTLKKL